MNKLILKSASLLTAAVVFVPVVAQTVSADTINPVNSTANVTFATDTTPTQPVDPTNPGVDVPGSVDPPTGESGPLSIDFASNLYFGTQSVTAKTAYAHAEKWADDTARPLYVQVTDKRGTFAGWNLSVKQESTLHLTGVTTPEASDTTLGDYLTGSQISFGGGYTANQYSSTGGPVVQSSFALNSGSQVVANAAANTGVGTWVYGFGTGASGTTSATLNANMTAYSDPINASVDRDSVATKSPVTLTIPASTNPSTKAAYTANLVWTLADTPSNS